MAPALTDAPADTHRIRFKLAPPSSALNASTVEANGTNGHILVSTNGAVKRKSAPEDEARLSCKSGPIKKEEAGRELGKIQQFVTSYRCSDEFQNVLGILPGFLPRKHQTLELSEEQLKSIMSAGNGNNGSGPCGQPGHINVNGMARKLSKPSKDSNGVTLNGGKPGQESLPYSAGRFTGNGSLLVASEEHQCTKDISRDRPNNQEIPEPPALYQPSFAAPTHPQQEIPNISLGVELSVAGSSGSNLLDRTHQAESRQSEIEGRLRRLRKRLQVVQAKQVERHVQQQLGGLLQSTLGPSRDVRGSRERAETKRFLKADSVQVQLEQLSVSGSTNLSAAESAFDSDATESSSGGETDVEEDELARADAEQRHFPL